MSTAYQTISDVFSRAHKIGHAMTFLGWDQMVMMPTNGMEPRSESIAELASIRHELLSGAALKSAFSDIDVDDLTDEQRISLREMHRAWQETVCLPADLVKAKIVVGSKCEHAWREQRGKNDWNGFLQNFTEVVELTREEARLRQAAGGNRFAVPYDALLDLHCRGDTSELISGVFATLKSSLPALLHEVMEVQKSDRRSPPAGTYPVAQQKQLNEKLMSTLGFDFESGRLDVSMHPFSTGGRGDQRITTRFREDEFADALQATAHETGHASYEAGLPAKWNAMPVGSSRNMCIHESQSLLFEKQIFLSRSFFQYFVPTLHAELANTSEFGADDLWHSYTRVRPSFIRVEADEVTYPMHVMLRYDIESALINGDIEAADIPALWNQKMQDYLGLDVGGEHSKGCLQDIHWTDGAFGYFPSYTMGAVNGAQLFATIKQQHPDWQDRFRRGDIGFVRQWLSDNIWSHGSFHESQELMTLATGEGSNADHLLEHLRARYLREEY